VFWEDTKRPQGSCEDSEGGTRGLSRAPPSWICFPGAKGDGREGFGLTLFSLETRAEGEGEGEEGEGREIEGEMRGMEEMGE